MLNSRSSKNAMTLAEVLMCVGVLGLIVAFTLPMLNKLIPTKEDSFHKKMNYVVEQVVTQLYDDESMYPRKSDFYAQGFQNLEKVTINSIEYGGDIKGNAAEQKKAKEKFCRLFASKFEMSSESGELVCENQRDDSKTGNKVILALGKRSFRSKDNVDWYLPVTDFKNGAAQIMIDVNNTDGPNCLEGSAGCTKPDRFLYYVKPNGSIAYERPINTTKNTFTLNVKVHTEGSSNVQTCASSKKCEIAEITKDAHGKDQYGTFYSDADHFTNLKSNTRYVIKAKPENDYYTTWSMDPKLKAPAKKVKIYNSDIDVDLKLHKKSTYCVLVRYENCDKDKVTDCAKAQITSGCGYTTEVAAHEKAYKLSGNGVYEYVGRDNAEAKYGYKCGGMEDPYGNIIVSKTTSLKHEERDGYPTAVVCGLTTGDYKLVVTPKTGYKLLPITTTHPNGLYEQDIRLGTEDITIGITLSR